MAKFVIQCPSCGKYAEARKGFFARKKIDCSCGYTIDVRTDKMASRECPHCKNMVVFDQTKGEKARCPVCGELINTVGDRSLMEEFSCAQCGIRLIADKNARTYQCPVCDCVNDVQERIAAERIKKSGLASIIKYEGNDDALIWKHPVEDFNMGSQLIVHESQEAIFFKDGQALDLFGPGRYTLTTQQLPLLEKVYRLPTDTEGTFHSEVYFINKTIQMAIRWGTPDKVRFIDPLTATPLELGASGELNLQVADSRKLLVKLVGTQKGIAWGDKEGFAQSLQSSFRPLIVNAVRTNLSSVIKQNQIDILEIDEHIDTISNSLHGKIEPGFQEYGLTVPQFYVSHIVLPEEDPNFQRIRELHTVVLQQQMLKANTAVKVTAAQEAVVIETAERQAELERQATETEVARREAERRLIEAQAEAESHRLAGMSEAAVMQAQGYNKKDVLNAEVQKAYAAGLGQMGANGGGSSAIGDIAGLGVAFGAMSNVMDMTRDVMNPRMESSIPVSAPTPAAPAEAGWDCTCGQKNITSRFCPACGAQKPQPPAGDLWDCACGKKGISSKFCPNCGAQRPAPADSWDCACGQKGITSKFCPNCGAKRPEKEREDWDCTCGQTGIVGNFCPNCGAKRPEKERKDWDCACGQTGILGNFCPNCGAKRPVKERTDWDCSCGQKGITGNFCPGCGKKRGE